MRKAMEILLRHLTRPITADVDALPPRLGLRAPANLVVPELARSGVTAVPAPDGTWRIGLAGGA